jgi:hypothetical protein
MCRFRCLSATGAARARIPPVPGEPSVLSA